MTDMDADSVDLMISDYGALPEAVVLPVFGHLPLSDLLHAASTCTHWHRCALSSHYFVQN